MSDTTTANNQAMTVVAAPLNAWCRVDVQIRVSTGAAQAWLYATNPDAQPRRCLDVSRARATIDFVARTSFEDGLRKTIDWFLHHRHEARL